MSAKSSARRNSGKNPYGNSSRRGRSWYLGVTIVVLLMATGVWTMTYTRSIGESTTANKAETPLNNQTPKAPLVNR